MAESRGARLRTLQVQLHVIELLAALHEVMSFRELAKRLGLSPALLSRYARGEFLPSPRRAQALLERLLSIVDLSRLVLSQLDFSPDGFVDLTRVLSNMSLLKLISYHVVELFLGRRITKVVTIGSDGIPLAVHVASMLRVPLVYAKNHRELGVSSYYEEHYVAGYVPRVLYLPKGAVRRTDHVLIIDDIVRSGDEQNALLRLLARRVNAKVTGLFTIVAIGDNWIDRLELPEECEAHALVVLPE